MNSKKAAIIALLLACLALSFPVPTTSQSGIVVTGADSTLTTSFTYSSGLVDTTQSIGPRVIAEYANSAIRHALTNIPAALQTLVDAVSDRVIVEYANSTLPLGLVSPPTALQTLVGAVTDRVVVEYANSTLPRALVNIPGALQALVDTMPDRVIAEYANSTQGMEMAYPLALMNDTAPPQISGIGASTVATDSVAITWTTDEFADSVVLYGDQPGVYPHTVSDALYVKGHALTLTGLVSGTTYYCKVRSTDQSSNTGESSEYSFTVQLSVYLPVVLRNR